MPSKYKCPVCGCTEYYSMSGASNSSNCPHSGNKSDNNRNALINANIDLNSFEFLDIRGFGVQLNAEVCLCANCGHIDLFNENLAKTFKADGVKPNK